MIKLLSSTLSVTKQELLRTGLQYLFRCTASGLHSWLEHRWQWCYLSQSYTTPYSWPSFSKQRHFLKHQNKAHSWQPLVRLSCFSSSASQNSAMNKGNIFTYEYTEDDFIMQTSPWVDAEADQLSKFDQEVHRRWDLAMASDIFRYDIDHIITRILPGPKHYVGQLNTLRATERRQPQEITCVNQPFNDKAFNFTWVPEGEVIFNLKKTNGSVGARPAEERHALIVNVSPMEYGHCLLLPQVDLKKPQILTKTAFEVAIETMLLSKHRGLRMGFNSLCAFASVNHLHFHFYYLNHELIVDHAPVHHLAGKYFEFTAIPCPGFALQLHRTTVPEMAQLAHRLSSYLHAEDIAHNVFMVRGCVFGEERNSPQTTIRLFIWPRRKFIGNKSSEEFNVACIELGGHLPIKAVEGYHTLTEAEVDAIIEDACLPQEQYEKIRQAVIKMGEEEVKDLKKSL